MQYQQNRLFEVNQRQFYKELDDSQGSDQPTPDANEAREFWSNIWDRPVEHRRDAGWLNDLKGKTQVEQQDDLTIDIDKLRAILRKIPNWKAPGSDNEQGFWLKSMKKLHERMALQLQECLDGRGIPEWMTRGRTVLLIKDKVKGNAVGNYRPITCLPIMWKVLTGIIAEYLYQHLHQSSLFPDEQKGCRKESRGTKENQLSNSLDRL